jgi:hypothetical protein
VIGRTTVAGFDIGDLDRFSYAPLRFYPSHAHILGDVANWRWS